MSLMTYQLTPQRGTLDDILRDAHSRLQHSSLTSVCAHIITNTYSCLR